MQRPVTAQAPSTSFVTRPGINFYEPWRAETKQVGPSGGPILLSAGARGTGGVDSAPPLHCAIHSSAARVRYNGQGSATVQGGAEQCTSEQCGAVHWGGAPGDSDGASCDPQIGDQGRGTSPWC